MVGVVILTLAAHRESLGYVMDVETGVCKSKMGRNGLYGRLGAADIPPPPTLYKVVYKTEEVTRTIRYFTGGWLLEYGVVRNRRRL